MDKVWLKQYPEGIPAEVDVKAYSSLKEILEKSCARFADLPAYGNMGVTITYRELDQMSRDFGAYLQKVVGLKKGDRLAIMLPNLMQYPVALFGAQRAGVVVVNTNPLYTGRELEHQLKDSGATAIVVLDVLHLSNLHRQTLHFNDDVGKPKVESAVETLKAYNPDVNIIAHNAPLTSDNAFGIIGQYDIVVNGADNFPSRYLVNDACYLLKKPLVDGCILMFDAQATVFLPGRGCYPCLYPSPPPPGLVPSCAQAGVLGALPGLVGSLQAIETIKLILGVGEPLVSRMFLYDALAAEFRQVRLRKYPECPLCGDHPTIHELVDYEAFCGAPAPKVEGAAAGH